MSITIARSIMHQIFSGSHLSPLALPRSKTFLFNPICSFHLQNHRHEFSDLANVSCQYLKWQNTNKTKRKLIISNVLPEPPISSGGFPGGVPGSWKGWLVGAVITVVIPLLINKWGAISQWTQKIGGALQSVENIVEAVEEVAEKVEKVAEDIIEDLPEGKLKTTLTRVEHVAEHVAEDAKKVDNMIDKIQEVEEKLDVYVEEAEQKEAAKKEQKQKEQKEAAKKEQNEK